MDATPLRVFTEEQQQIWRALYKKLIVRVEKYACQDYLTGFELLELPEDHIPTLEYLNERITPRTGWKCVHTSVRYTSADDWYPEFAKKHFLITDYIRSWEEIEWTHEPDMFHDIFGHLPFMTLKHYAELEEMFAPAYLRATTDEQKENIKRLAWFSTEFGLIRENGERKLFGAGLISGAEELDNVVQNRVPVMPFTIENVIQYDKAVYTHNKQLFEFESIDALKTELARYFDTV